MSSLQSIRDAIKTTLESAIDSLSAYDTVPGATNLPAVVVVPSTANFNVAMGRGTDTWEFDLAVMVPYTDADIAQDALDNYVTGAGDSSIRQAIFQNRDLGLSDTDAHISGMSDYGSRFEMAGIQNIGAKLRLVVHTKGTT
jgi:hypothetical protein